jgi:AcrR family transcriptional regulator
MSAAAALFISKGIDATTVDDIVVKAKASKGTFYHYFRTKTEVVLALRAKFVENFVVRTAAAVDACPAEDHAARFSGWISSAVETYLANYELHDVVFHDFTHSQRRSREKDAVIAQLAALFEAGQRAGSWQLLDARAAALIVFDGMHGVVDDAIGSGQRDPQPLVKLLTETFLRMLRR